MADPPVGKPMSKVVISQSMYFPWAGLLEQVHVSDIFVHYNDVQLTRGFYNRVQVKTHEGSRWITVPLREWHRGQLICEVSIDERINWRSQHRDVLRQAYRKAPYCNEMLGLVDEVFSRECKTVADIARESLLALVRYFNLDKSVKFCESSELGVLGSSSERLLGICLAVGAKIYITGHGARNYLNHALFERSNLRVEYMNYRRLPYTQLHGEFTPFVTGLDLVANCGRDGSKYLISDSIYWKEFMNELN